MSPDALYAGSPVTFTSTSTDPDKDALTARWDFDGNGVTDASGDTVTWTFTAPATVTVTLNVIDAAGESGSVSRQIGIVAPPPPPVADPPAAPTPPPTNVKPVAEFTVDPAVPVVGQPITFSSTSVDADGVIAVERWDLNGDGKFTDAAGPVA